MKHLNEQPGEKLYLLKFKRRAEKANDLPLKPQRIQNCCSQHSFACYRLKSQSHKLAWLHSRLRVHLKVFKPQIKFRFAFARKSNTGRDPSGFLFHYITFIILQSLQILAKQAMKPKFPTAYTKSHYLYIQHCLILLLFLSTLMSQLVFLQNRQWSLFSFARIRIKNTVLNLAWFLRAL